MICESPMVIASGSSTEVSGGLFSMALNASPVNTGTTAASAALPTAPTNSMMMIQ